MGNGYSALCIRRSAVVRVIRPDGGIEEFDYPIQVSYLMSLFPDYLVVHCVSVDHPAGPRNRITVMDGEEFLVAGRSYILYPVPAQFKKSFSSSRAPRPSSASAKFGRPRDNREVTRNHPTTGPPCNCAKTSRMQGLVHYFRHILTGESSVHNSPQQYDSFEQLTSVSMSKDSKDIGEESDRSSAFDYMENGAEEEPEQQQQRERKKKPQLTLDPYYWSPDLDCIPESPLGFHDSQSPFEFHRCLPKLLTPISLSPATSARFTFDMSVTPPISPRRLGFAQDTFPLSPRGKKMTQNCEAGFMTTTTPRSPRGQGFSEAFIMTNGRTPGSPQGLGISQGLSFNPPQPVEKSSRSPQGLGISQGLSFDPPHSPQPVEKSPCSPQELGISQGLSFDSPRSPHPVEKAQTEGLIMPSSSPGRAGQSPRASFCEWRKSPPGSPLASDYDGQSQALVQEGSNKNTPSSPESKPNVSGNVSDCTSFQGFPMPSSNESAQAPAFAGFP